MTLPGLLLLSKWALTVICPAKRTTCPGWPDGAFFEPCSGVPVQSQNFFCHFRHSDGSVKFWAAKSGSYQINSCLPDIVLLQIKLYFKTCTLLIS